MQPGAHLKRYSLYIHLVSCWRFTMEER